MPALKLDLNWGRDEESTALSAPALAGALSDTFHDGHGASPAHLLQQRLARAYLEPAAPVAQVARYRLNERVAIIVALSSAMWLGIAGVTALAWAFIA